MPIQFLDEMHNSIVNQLFIRMQLFVLGFKKREEELTS